MDIALYTKEPYSSLTFLPPPASSSLQTPPSYLQQMWCNFFLNPEFTMLNMMNGSCEAFTAIKVS